METSIADQLSVIYRYSCVAGITDQVETRLSTHSYSEGYSS